MEKAKKIEVNTNRVLYSQENDSSKITLVCVAGIHGNEPAGIYGLQKIISVLKKNTITLNGNFYALKGNLKALKHKVRYIDYDLNRLWTEDGVKNIKGDKKCYHEFEEQLELYSEIKTIINSHSGKFVFLDLHTTSSKTIPFITISDSLNNRKLAKKFNVPIVLGIEEYLSGPLLTFINEFGHTSLGFEAGQHDDDISVQRCEAFLWLIMQQLNLISNELISSKNYEQILNVSVSKNGFYEIVYRYNLDAKHHAFKMLKQFENFESIIKNELLAKDNGFIIKSPLKGLIFMPLYQNQGEDGFFIVRKISKFWLVFSKIIRKLYIHNVLSWFPGVKKEKDNAYTLIVNPKKARFLAREIFHLFGYRARVKKGELMYVTKRDRKIKVFH